MPELFAANSGISTGTRGSARSEVTISRPQQLARPFLFDIGEKWPDLLISENRAVILVHLFDSAIAQSEHHAVLVAVALTIRECRISLELDNDAITFGGHCLELRPEPCGN